MDRVPIRCVARLGSKMIIIYGIYLGLKFLTLCKIYNIFVILQSDTKDTIASGESGGSTTSAPIRSLKVK